MTDALHAQTRAVAPPLKLTLAKRLQRALGQDWNVAYVFMAPTVILMGGLIAYPFLRAVYISFTNTTAGHRPLCRADELQEPVERHLFRRSVVITAKFHVVIGGPQAHRWHPSVGAAEPPRQQGRLLTAWSCFLDHARHRTEPSPGGASWIRSTGGISRLLITLGLIKRPCPSSPR